jgi:uncharacterized protein HemX
MNNTELVSPEELPSQLPEPHFDDETIANAQPVEPLATVNRWPTEWATRRTVVSTAAMIVLAVGMATTLSLGAVLVKLHQSNALATETEVTSTQARNEDERAGTSTASAENGPTQKIKPRKMKLYVPNNQSKPVARKVGVIYGR